MHGLPTLVTLLPPVLRLAVADPVALRQPAACRVLALQLQVALLPILPATVPAKVQRVGWRQAIAWLPWEPGCMVGWHEAHVRAIALQEQEAAADCSRVDPQREQTRCQGRM